MAANIVSAVPSGETSVAAGMNANIRTIGGSIGAAVMASIVTAKLEPSGLPAGAGYTTGFGVMAAVVLVAALAALLIPSPRRGTTVPEAADMEAGVVATAGEVAPGTWRRFLDIHLAGLRAPGPLSATPSMSAGQLAELLPRR